MDEAAITVIGAGVVGLAIAAELSAKYRNVIVLEKHESYGRETSSRNSEVIHSGIYYPEGSLKTILCQEGATRLYDLCGTFGIPHRKLGKVIIATAPEELAALKDLFRRGMANHVPDLVMLDGKDLRRLEPHTNGIAAIYSPWTGIVDSHSLMTHLYKVGRDRGVIFAFNSELDWLSREKDCFVAGVKQERYRYRSRVVINAAGLWSDQVARLAGLDVEKLGYRIRFCKGSYFCSQKPSPVKMLVYPIPHDELVGLGIHATLDMNMRLRFGPDVEYVDKIDYQVDTAKQEFFFAGASKIIPGLDRDAFSPDMAGIRPKLQGPGEKARDFVICEESEKGLPGLVNLIGIESPGLTASLAIAKKVADLVSFHI
jgi:L-2-hydroxyglutarate oxidase LhgO